MTPAGVRAMLIVAGAVGAAFSVVAVVAFVWLAARGAQISQQQNRQCQYDSQAVAGYPAGSVSRDIARAQFVADGCGG